MPKILIIDDDIFIRENLKKILLLEDYSVITAENAKNGMELFIAENPEIVLLDIKMPDCNGTDILKDLKKKSPLTEVIMITGHGDVEVAIETFKDGAFGFIQKPIDYNKLIIEIYRAFDKQKMHIQIQEYHTNLEIAIKEKTDELTKRIIAEDALRQNINEGRTYQTKLIKTNLPKIYNFRFDKFYLPYDKVGGDFYNIILMENKLIFYIADVSGHGVSSAIISSFVKTLLDNWIKNDSIISPLELVNRLKNSLKTEEIFHENMLTLFIGNLDITSLKMTYLSAGHHMPIIITENGHIKLENSFRPLSNLLDFDSYYEEILSLSNNTRMLFFSDGLIEWKKPDNSISGKPFLIEYIDQNSLTNRSILNLIEMEISDRREDDISFILIDINDKYENKYNCTLDNLNFIINDIQNELTKRYVLDERTQSKIFNCLDEAIVNAIEHGNGNSRDKSVNLSINFRKERLSFTIRDEGSGFDWNKVLEDKSIQTDKMRGRGFFIIKHFTNGFNLNEKGNEITLSFILP